GSGKNPFEICSWNRAVLSIADGSNEPLNARPRRWSFFSMAACPFLLLGLPSSSLPFILSIPMGSELNYPVFEHSSTSPLGGFLSAIFPGLGHLVRGYPNHMVWVL